MTEKLYYEERFDWLYFFGMIFLTAYFAFLFYTALTFWGQNYEQRISELERNQQYWVRADFALPWFEEMNNKIVILEQKQTQIDLNLACCYPVDCPQAKNNPSKCNCVYAVLCNISPELETIPNCLDENRDTNKWCSYGWSWQE